MEISVTSYRRHAADCAHRADRYHPRCGCPLWGQFNWPKPKTFFRGKKLNRGQNKWSLETRSWKEASKQAQQLENYLNDLRVGKPVQPAGKEVEAAVKQWLQFRSTNGISNTKARLLGDKLIEWCRKNDVVLLTALTPEHAINFRMSLPFRTGDSPSLSVHWSIINGFFNWAEGMGYIEKNPTPSPKLNPQFKIKFKKKEVVPPTSEQVQKVIDTATGRVKLLVLLMRWTGMALVDAQKFGMSREDVEKFRLPKPERRPVVEDVTLIRGNRTKSNERYRVRMSQSLAKQLRALGPAPFGGTYSQWRERLNKLFRDAGVNKTPHGFRHFRISEWLAQGYSVEDVSKWVGTSPKEIRKTYEHWIKETEDRSDDLQRESWIAQGLDEYGDEVVVQ